MKRKFNRNVSIMLASTVILTTAFSNVSFANANTKETTSLVSNRNVSLLNDETTSEGAIYLVEIPEGNPPSQAVQTKVDSIPEGSMALKMETPKLQYKTGSIATVDLYIENNKGFAGSYIDLSYDEQYLKPIPFEKNEMYKAEDGFIYADVDGDAVLAYPAAKLNAAIGKAEDGVIKIVNAIVDSAGAPMNTEMNGKLLRIKFEVLKEGITTVRAKDQDGAFLNSAADSNPVTPMYTQEGVIIIGDKTIGKEEAANFTVGQNNKVTVKANAVGAVPTVTVAGDLFVNHTMGAVTADSAVISVSEKSLGSNTLDSLIAELVANIGGNGISAKQATNAAGEKGLIVTYGGEGQDQEFGIYFNTIPIPYENANFTVGASDIVTVVADNSAGTNATVSLSGSILSKAAAAASATDASATVTVPKSALGSKKLFSLIASMVDTVGGNAKKADMQDSSIVVTYGENQTYKINFVVKDDSDDNGDDDDNNNNGGGSSSGGGGGGGSSNKAAKQSTDNDKKDPVTPVKPVTPSKSVSFVTKTGVTITPPTTSLGTKTFTDISSRPWAEASINKLSSLGIINGVGNEKFAPDANSKRADFMVMMAKVLGLTGSSSNNFDDVTPDKYYAQAVGQLKEIGIASGVGNNKFNPEGSITRQDMMAIVARALDMIGALPEADPSVLDKFADRDKIAPYAVDSLAALVELGIVNGTGENLEPTALITRAQMSVIMAKVYDIVVDKAYEAQESTTSEEVTDEEDSSETSTEEDSTETTTDEDSTETTTEEEEE